MLFSTLTCSHPYYPTARKLLYHCKLTSTVHWCPEAWTLLYAYIGTHLNICNRNLVTVAPERTVIFLEPDHESYWWPSSIPELVNPAEHSRTCLSKLTNLLDGFWISTPVPIKLLFHNNLFSWDRQSLGSARIIVFYLILHLHAESFKSSWLQLISPKTALVLKIERWLTLFFFFSLFCCFFTRDVS